jgi:hypothetical protein
LELQIQKTNDEAGRSGVVIVAPETYEVEKQAGVVERPKAGEPYRNPTYPERDHFAERARLDEVLRASQGRVDEARRILDAHGDSPGTAEAVRLYHQLLGVRDQIAECARRIPLEAGALYKEDRERFEQATAALERVWQRWEKAVG